MDAMLIKACGTAQQVVSSLKALKAVFPQGFSLAAAAQAIRYTRILAAEKEQFTEGRNSK